MFKHRVLNWVLDTGSGNHLVCRSQIDNRHLDDQRSVRPKKLQTANGVVEVDKVMSIHPKALGQEFDAIVPDNTANVVSLGKLCLEMGFTFVWQSYGQFPV